MEVAIGLEPFSVGQVQKFTKNLHNLLRRYPKGLGILKEFIQNADDAGASSVKVLMDWRRYEVDGLPREEMRDLMGPALLVCNDRAFSDEDLTNIQELGDSNKVLRVSSIGRFGYGFNSCYNVTDCPSFVTRDVLYCFDPHLRFVPVSERPGAGWHLDKLWQHCPDLLAPFMEGGLKEGTTFFDNTVFRLPLRTPEQAENSEISGVPFTRQDFEDILAKAASAGAELLLFLKSVLHVEVWDIEESGERHLRLSLSTPNADIVEEHRRTLREAVGGDHSEMMDWLGVTVDLPKVYYRHEIAVERDGESYVESWQVVSGLFDGEGRPLLSAAAQMIEREEKAVPWAGAAARVAASVPTQDGGEDNEDADGRVGRAFCFLPLPQETGVPVHLNGFFDLDDSRQKVTHDKDTTTTAEHRTRWNELLVRYAVAPAYAELLRRMAEGLDPVAAADYYALWPQPSPTAPAPFDTLSERVYELLVDAPVVLCAGRPEEPQWRPLGEVLFVPPSPVGLREAMVVDGALVPDRSFPRRIREGLVNAGARECELTPKVLRARLRMKVDPNTLREDATRPCLRRTEWLVAMLRHCLEDKPQKHLAGVPLALTSAGRIHTFIPPGTVMFLADEEGRALFPQCPDWFIDAEYALATGIDTDPNAVKYGVRQLDLARAMDKLKVVVGQGTEFNWDPAGDSLPNEEWLGRVYSFLRKRKRAGETFKLAVARKRPIVPDRSGKLVALGLLRTPLLAPPEADEALLDALTRLGVPLVGGPPGVVELIRTFAGSSSLPRLMTLTPYLLVESLASNSADWESWADAETMGPVLDYLARPTSVAVIKEDSACAAALDGLPILPTDRGRLASATEKAVYLPAADRPPPTAKGAELYLVGKDERWRSLLEALEVIPLDLATYVSDLLSGFAELAPSDRVAALAWLRDNLEAAKTQLDKREGPSAVKVLEAAVRETPLVTDRSGTLRKVTEVYDPRSEDKIRPILGESARFPDKAVYGEEWKRLLKFFERLGLPRRPRAEDVLARVDELLVASGRDGIATVADQLSLIYNHLAANWGALADRKVGGQTLAMALASRAWLPPLIDPTRLGRYAAYTVPEERLYRPSELYPSRLGHLIASQRPLQPFSREPKAEVAGELGFPKAPDLDDVIAHFDALVATWGNPDHGGLDLEPLQRSLSAIYQYFGTMLQDETALVNLRRHYVDRPCIWSPKHSAFFPASKVFAKRARGLEPFAVMVSAKEASVSAGFEALGRREVPDIEDYAAFLESLQSGEGERLSEEDAERALRALKYMGEVAAQEERELPTVLMLTDDLRLLPASQVYKADAPWYEGRLERSLVNLLHKRVVSMVATLAGVRSLDASIDASLTERVRSDDPAFAGLIQNLQEVARSEEFAEGLRRLVIAEHEYDRGEDRRWLSRLGVVPVEALRTTLRLDLEGTPTVVGAGEDDYYFEDECPVIYVAESTGDLAPTFLAEALNHEFEPALSDKGPLEKILSAEPGDIMGLLDKLRVPPLEHEEEEADDASEEEGGEEVSFASTDPREEESSGGVSLANDPASDEEEVYVEEDRIHDGIGEHGSTHELKTEAGDPAPQHDDDDGTATQPLASSGSAHVKDRESTSRGAGSAEDSDSTDAHSSGVSRTQTEPQTSPTERPPLGSKDHWRVVERDGETASPSQPSGQGGRAKTTRQSGFHRGRKISYLYADEAPFDCENFTFDGEERRLEVGEAAVQRVLENEKDRGRYPKNMGHYNEGYDVESFDEAGVLLRHIEVKGLVGAWGDRGVPLSRSQFEFALKYADTFWLYVVEWAEDPERANVYPLRDPLRKVAQFRFDVGWTTVAEDPIRCEDPATR